MTTAKPRPPLAPGETRVYPALPLRDIVVFPHMIAALFVGRKKSILALDEAIRSDSFILLATQKNDVSRKESIRSQQCERHYRFPV
jgi:ATP-dependent Lon protease